MQITTIRVFLALGLALFWLGCSGEKPQQQGMPAMPVQTMLALGEDISTSYSYPAKLVSEEDVVLKPKVSGAITQKLFKAGDRVKKDQVLFIIEQDKYQAANEIAKGEWLVARANFYNAQQEHERNEALIAKQAISKKEYDTSLAAFRSATANLEAAAASYKSAQIDLNYSSVSAPFDGVVGDALVNVGEYVNATASELVRITNLNPIYADFYISDKDKMKLDQGLSDNTLEFASPEANITILGQNFKGKVYFISSVIENSSANVKAKAIFDNNESKLIPGTITTISMNGFLQKKAYKIPQIAVMQDQREAFVYTIDNAKVKKIPIQIAYQDNQFVIASSGLKDGDKIILDNFKKISVGSSVQEAGSR
ncbi:efflux RND transporter periplasmic adaptor subunit [Campylobacter sp. MIT 12-8780]|uniref:efflux RND transporter periplasmic adaptor subunit n=1 Tax=Campylobacter sp. MIT 12-8780 TaxID=2202200 RepID=UPI00115CF819|nr:efflux RND transporter periplasmic adaptor subunit [Campylobacter sp. MIT 12-8780]TQR40189.1 efflux RND transporter periplasmic adaptor subunit [Campylobacter sp. MIT 12-8780]